jgi:hypothetical protein
MKNMHRPPCDDEGELVSEATHKKYLSVQTEGKIVIKMIHRPPYKSHSERFLSLFYCEESINVGADLCVRPAESIQLRMLKKSKSQAPTYPKGFNFFLRRRYGAKKRNEGY